jgi:hypothetical protein
MSDDNFDLQQERDRLAAEVARLRVERETGVPASLLRNATTEAEARAFAEQALAWRGNQPPAAPPQSAPQYLPNQINRQTLAYMSPQEVSEAHRRGQLEGIGAPAPAPRKTGERNGRTL